MNAPSPPAPGTSPPPPPPTRKAKWPWITGGVVLALCVGVVVLDLYLPHAHVKTDDAYVTAHYAVIAPRVSGQVIDVAIDDNQVVKKGQLLVALDSADYETAVAQAQASLSEDLAQVSQAQVQVERQPALILQADAQVRAADAALTLAKANDTRYAALSRIGAGSTQQQQEHSTTLRQQAAALQAAQASLTAARDQLNALRALRDSMLARVGTDRARLRQARLNLSYTRITAPLDGVVDQRTVQAGNIVSPGAAMLTVVPLQDVWIEANYRELELRHMRPGQPARIHVDAYDIWLDGIVESIAPSSGAAYSPIPPNNATGNFTKIVQRLPVKIILKPGQPNASLLHIGMSVETVVDTGLADVTAGGRAAVPPARPNQERDGT